MAISPGRGHGALRRGRWSDAGVEYFLTCCTDERASGLETGDNMQAIVRTASALSAEGKWLVRTFVVMPDHVHLLIVLGNGIELSDAVRLFKGRLAPVLRAAGLRWERGYFDHRLRSDEDRLPVFRYIFLNPHRAGLVPAHEKWRGYFCAEEDWVWFVELTAAECPWPEWLL